MSLQEGCIEIKLDFMGKPFIVNACDTDGGSGKLSTKKWLYEEISNIGLEDTLYGTDFVDGIYEVTTVGSWDYEHTEFVYEIEYTLVKEIK